jgi:hypothetical protein
MRSLAVLVEFLVQPSFIAQFSDLIAANAKASLEREMGLQAFRRAHQPRGAASLRPL